MIGCEDDKDEISMMKKTGRSNIFIHPSNNNAYLDTSQELDVNLSFPSQNQETPANLSEFTKPQAP